MPQVRMVIDLTFVLQNDPCRPPLLIWIVLHYILCLHDFS
jgi:hypothetical protein